MALNPSLAGSVDVAEGTPRQPPLTFAISDLE